MKIKYLFHIALHKYVACHAQTCHNADYTEDYFDCGWNIWRQNLKAFRENQTLATLVDKKMGY